MVEVGEAPTLAVHVAEATSRSCRKLRGLLSVMALTPTYGAAFADVYDDWYGNSDDLTVVAALLCAHEPNSVLELGVGTGRVALALANLVVPAGGRVVGVDESPEMLACLADKDPQRRVTAVLGDMVDNQPNEAFDLIFISYNTLFNVADRDKQARCLANAATRLSPTGRLVIDACIIDPGAPTSGVTEERRGAWQVHTTSNFAVATGIVSGLTISTHDDTRRVLRPWRIAYQSPLALDGTCAASGLRLVERYASWHKTPFSDDAVRHVSIYRNLR